MALLNILKRNVSSCYAYLQRNGLHTSGVIRNSHKKVQEPAVVLSEDGSTIYCWHPEQSFPYEHTKPLPRNEEELKQGDSVLKVQHLETGSRMYRSDGPTDAELCEMFSTGIHVWRHQPEKRRIKKNPPKDRESV